MRIAVNGKSMGVAEQGGAVRVAHNVIRHMALAAPDIEFDVLLPNAMLSTGLPANVRLIEVYPLRRADGLRKQIWEQLLLPAYVRRAGVYSLLLNLTNSAPVLRSPGVPQLLLLHDAGFLNREWFSAAYSRYVTWLVRAAGRRGIQIVTVSETAAAQLHDAFPRLPRPVAIANGIDDAPLDIQAPTDTPPYVLFLGSMNPRKNLAGALRGFRHYKDQTNGDLHMLVVGAEKSMFRAAGSADAAVDDVHFLGYVDESRKWSLLSGAQALLLPSFLEGFGLPVGEAIKLGTPVVVSDIPVFRELFGEIPVYVTPESPASIAAGLARVVNEAGAGRAAPEQQQAFAGRFAWSTAAAHYLSLLRSLVARSGGAVR